jgi:hypothetical protein
MTNFLHWRKMTWALGAWSIVMATWLVAGSTNTIIVVALWLVGLSALGLLWFTTQPPVRTGRGLEDFFVRPRGGDWRVMNLHRDAPESAGRRARAAALDARGAG